MLPRPGTEHRSTIPLEAMMSRPVGCEEDLGAAGQQTVTETTPTQPERGAPTAGHLAKISAESYHSGDGADRLVPDLQRVAHDGLPRGDHSEPRRRAIGTTDPLLPPKSHRSAAACTVVTSTIVLFSPAVGRLHCHRR